MLVGSRDGSIPSFRRLRRPGNFVIRRMHLFVASAVPFPARQLRVQFLFDESRRLVAQLVHLIEPIKLRPDHGSLQRTEREGFAGSVHERPDPGGQSLRIHQQRPAAASGDQLAASEAERGKVTKAADGAAVDLHPRDLARILDQDPAAIVAVLPQLV